ncbi:glycosyltransferase family 39 protein [bacterium]|nr:glycosyltransferase family 39 protein [bacterium]MDC0322547.1 glycosyltransferase family 39 protein [Verrucomicrobiales bacterium]
MKSKLHSIWSALRSRFGVFGLLLVAGVIAVGFFVDRDILTKETSEVNGIREKYEAGDKLSIRERIELGNWDAELGIGFLCVILLGSCWLWARKLPENNGLKIDRRKLSWKFWLPLLLAVVLAGNFRAPRLDHSLWNDEELAVRKYIVGSYVVDPATGNLEFNPVSWERTFFYSLSGNNHIVQSVMSRIGNSVWAKAIGAEKGAFSESALRMGSLIAALATVALFGFWLAREGHPVAGITGAFILALNPWHIRYAVEARGYSVLLLFVVLLFFCLHPALLTNRWRWWIGFGAAQTMALLSFAASLLLIAPLNLVVLVLLAKGRNGYGFWRWAFVCACGAGLVGFFMLPTIIGSMGWLSTLREVELNRSEWPRELWGHMMLGTHWFTSNPKFEDGIGIRNMLDSGVAMQVLITVGIPLLALVGIGIAIAKNAAARLHIFVMAGAILVIGMYRSFSDTPFHIWYAIYLLLLFIVAFGFLGEAATLLFKIKASRRGIVQAIGVVVVVGFYGWISQAPRESIVKFERHPMRAAVGKVRGDKIPAVDAGEGLVTVSFGSGAKQLQSYDPRVRSPKTLQEFEGTRVQARKNGDRLVVYVTGPLHIKLSKPEILAVLEDKKQFKNRGLVKGIESFWGIQIYEAKK